MDEERTVTFDVWPDMLMIEGTSLAIGMLIAMLYDDPAVPNDAWAISRADGSRKTYAAELKRAGTLKKRQGIGVRNPGLVPIIAQRAKALGLSCFPFSKKTSGG